MTELSNAEFIVLTREAWPIDISPSSQAWLTDKLNETLSRLEAAEGKIEQQQECIRKLKRNCEDFRWLYDQRALGPLDAAAQYGPNYEPPTDEQCLEIRGKIEQAIAKAEELIK